MKLTARQFMILRTIYMSASYDDKLALPEVSNHLSGLHHVDDARYVLEELIASKIFSLSPDGYFVRLTAEGRDVLESKIAEQTDWERPGIVRNASVLGDELLVRAGSTFTAQRAINQIFAKAKKTLDIVDPYFGQEVLERISDSGTDANVRFLTAKISGISTSYFKAFVTEHPGFVLGKTKGNLHDRFIILDGETAYQIGHSIKDAGVKDTRISKLKDVAALQQLFDERWNQAEIQKTV